MVFLALFLVWLVFNGRFTFEVAAFGLVLSSALYFFVRKFIAPGMTMKGEAAALRRVPLMLGYLRFLVREILKANLQTLRFILSDREEVVPKLAVFTAKLRTQAARVALADSITLTPGTITVSLEHDRYTVHCLDESFAEGLEDSGFEQRLRQIEEAAGTGSLPERGEE